MMKFWLRIAGAILLIFLLAGAIVGVLAALDLTQSVLGRYTPGMFLAGFMGILFAAALLWYIRAFGDMRISDLGFHWRSRHAGFIAMIVPLTLAMAWGYMMALDSFGFRSLGLNVPQWSAIAAGIIGSLSILHEEILNRGYIMTMFRRRYSVGAALLISSFLFMLIHIPTRGLSYLVITWFGMGLVYGYLYLKSGSLWVAYAFHAVHNFAADLLMYTNNEIGLFQFDPALGAAGHLPFRLILALTAIGLIYLWYGRGTPFLAPAPELARSWAGLAEDGPARAQGQVDPA